MVRSIACRRTLSWQSGNWSTDTDKTSKSKGHRFGAKRKAMPAVPFSELAAQQLTRVHSCVQVLHDTNASFSCTLTASERVDITIANDHGEARWELSTKPAVEQLQLYSTISGVLDYEYSDVKGKWINADDGHDLEGLLMRDLLRICVGCPAF